MVMHNPGTFDRIGRGGHTLQRWENDASRMCGDINRQDIVYKSAGHRPDLGLASGRLFVIGRQSEDHPSDVRRPISKETSPDDLPTIVGDTGRFHSWLGCAPSRQSVDRCSRCSAGITTLPADGSTIVKNQEGIGNILTCAPIADWRCR